MENEKIQENKKKSGVMRSLALTLVLLLVLVVAVVGVTYAVFTWSATSLNRANNIISTGAIDCSINEGSPISLNAAHPISDAQGKILTNNSIAGYTQGYYDVIIACTCAGNSCSGTYDISLENVSSGNVLDEQYVNTYLTDGAVGTETELAAVRTFNSLDTDVNGNKSLYRGSFTGSFSETYRLRVWLDESYVVSGTSSEFKALVNVDISGN